jgi:DNA invertase Pin-like site-specific DNA recombinase
MDTKKTLKRNATVALCYIRQSQTRNDEDTNSPLRQRANITMVCEKYGWTPEWYEDAEGHKSGRDIKNRPGWLALQARLGDSDVVALVANDLSRLHRKGWRVGDLIDHLEQYQVGLVLAAPGREVDTGTPTGKMFIQFTAMLDEYYADDISQRAKDSINHRRNSGKAIGLAPYGTTRDANGFLIPSPEGAWLLPDGTFQLGVELEPPHPDAIWRSYFVTAKRIFELYAENKYGNVRIAYMMNEQGYPFRDRWGKFRPFAADDIRRAVNNWDKYGGRIVEKRSKERRAYELGSIEEIPLDAERAVLPLELLRRVGSVLKERSVKPLNRGQKPQVHSYPLSHITYCSHCEKLAKEQDNLKLRTTLTGSKSGGIYRYRHLPGIRCGVVNQSVPAEEFEAEFARLVQFLEVDQPTLELMIELAIQADKSLGATDENIEEKKVEAIALCRRKIEAAVNLYSDGMIGREEYLRRKDTNEREIAHWEARTTETQKIALEFALCVEALQSFQRLWGVASGKQKQDLVRNLFDYILFDLNTRRITDFRLKAWADKFFVVRASLLLEENESVDIPEENENATGFTGVWRDMPPTGFKPSNPVFISSSRNRAIQTP